MAPTRFVLLTLALLAFVSLASAGPVPKPTPCSESCDKTSLQNCAKITIDYYESLITNGGGSDPGLISKILEALGNLLSDIEDLLTCKDLNASVLTKLLNIIFRYLDQIVKCLLDLLAGKITEEECFIRCQAVVNKCIAECKAVPGSRLSINHIIASLTNLLEYIFGSGGNPPCNGSGTDTGTSSGTGFGTVPGSGAGPDSHLVPELLGGLFGGIRLVTTSL